MPNQVGGLFRFQRAVLQPQRVFCKPLDVQHGAWDHAVAHARKEHPRVIAFQLAQGVCALADLFCEPVQIGLAALGPQSGPGRKRALRRLNRLVHMLGKPFRHMAQQVLVNGAMQLKGFGGAYSLAVDVMIW
ncbi:hypothetical protein D3C71_1478210 [compost metagenome]